MTCETFLAIDWGTTNRRVYLVEGGDLVSSATDARGVRSGCDFAADVAEIRARLGNHPMLLAGMVGSTIGWREAPYVSAPASVRDLATNLLRIDERTVIVTGVSVATPPDVMRGEEVQLLGAVSAGFVPPDARLIQPGTHCKWVWMANGQIVGFTTAMTGELFSLLRRHSLLAPQLNAEVTIGSAFLEGVVDGKRRDLAASLFQIRAAKLLGRRQDAEAASYASGLLIGSDVAARVDAASTEDFYILADAALGSFYAAALEAHGRRAHFVDSHLAFVAGIKEIAGQWEM